MACACKVNQQLSYLQKKYGVGGPKKKPGFSVNAKVLVVNIFDAILAILLSPIMLMTILFNRKGVINISKLFGLSGK